MLATGVEIGETWGRLPRGLGKAAKGSGAVAEGTTEGDGIMEGCGERGVSLNPEKSSLPIPGVVGGRGGGDGMEELGGIATGGG